MGKNEVTVLKKGVPKLREVKDYDQQINISLNSVDALKQAFDAAIPQLGRELGKSNHYGRKAALDATSLAADVSIALTPITDTGYHGRINALALAAGYEAESWTVTDKCGNTKRVDWDDLYEDGTEVELVIRISRKLKDAKELNKAGVK
jgi:hypothetical protein